MSAATATPAALIAAARQLFARHGYAGASVRAITRLARVNLGAVTYHFGSKAALYDATLASITDPFRERLARAAATEDPALDRIERVVRAVFEYLHEQPDFGRFIPQVMARGRNVPGPVRRTMEANHGLIAGLIRQGQKDGTIRRGDARLMALSVGAQPFFLTLMQAALQRAIAVDQHQPAVRERLVRSVIEFVRAGLAAKREQP
jgi:AcrR family transcriptional regulator